MSKNQELCVICERRPAAGYLGNYPLCLTCYNAVSSPDPICFDCGEPLTEADIEAEETMCGECRNAPGASCLRPRSAVGEDWEEA